MKAEESVKNYPASVRMYTNYTVREIKKICKNIGPRIAGSEQEHEAHKYIAEEMKTCCDKVDIEDFKLSPEAFMSWVRIDGALVILAVIFAWLTKFVDVSFNFAWVSVALVAVALVFLFCEFLMYWEFYDFLFPKATSHNTIGVRKAGGETKQRIIFSGHVDSSHEWTYTRLGGAPLLFAVGGYGIVSMLFVLVSSILIVANVGTPELQQILRYIQLACIPGGIAVMFFVNFNITVEGANDNLTGTLAAATALKMLDEAGINFKNTEVVAMITDGEEAGLRGAKQFAKDHYKEYMESGVETAVLCVDTLTDRDYLNVYSRDMTGTVKHDPAFCHLVMDAAIEAGHDDLEFANVFFGSSDAAAFTQAGITATCLAAMDPSPADYYHNRRDSYDRLVPEAIEASYDIIMSTILKFADEDVEVKKEETAE